MPASRSSFETAAVTAATAYRPRLDGRVAVVTGGGRNIGRALALGLAECGAAVVAADIAADDAQAVAADIEAAGGAALPIGLDIADRAAVQAMAEAVMDRFGRVDILINNAALFSALGYRDFWDIPEDEWDRVIETNVTGTFNCVRAVEGAMRAAGWGRIVNVSSGTVRMGRPHFLHYVSSKAALVGMSRSLARELGPFGITVNTLLPGVVLHETQRARLPDEYKAAILRSQCIPRELDTAAMVGPVLFLVSEEAAFVTGQELAVDGGLTHG